VGSPAAPAHPVLAILRHAGHRDGRTQGAGAAHVPGQGTSDRITQDGLRDDNFHSTALRSPTRAALKFGRNHQTVAMGFITELATSMPGQTGKMPSTTAPLAETLRLNDYATAAFGKWHETAAWETRIAGAFDRWPAHQGFDTFYGFLGGETNQWAPFLYDGNAVVELPNDPQDHFMTDMTGKARAWIKYQKALTPERPAFVHFAPGRVRPRPAPRPGLRGRAGRDRPAADVDTARAAVLQHRRGDRPAAVRRGGAGGDRDRPAGRAAHAGPVAGLAVARAALRDRGHGELAAPDRLPGLAAAIPGDAQDGAAPCGRRAARPGSVVDTAAPSRFTAAASIIAPW
jgi:arylsulfatase A-like enzyme